jgi:protein tyrosine/serine phosphatase
VNSSILKNFEFLGNPIVGLFDSVCGNSSDFRMQKISNSFYRSSDVSMNIPELAKYGIKTILNLKIISKEELKKLTEIAKEHGIEYINIPINPFKLQDNMDEILDVIKTASEENPLLVHCTFGRDRTGFVTALYQNLKEDVPMQEAISDMYEHGFRRLFFNMEQYLRGFNKTALDA